MQRETDYEAFGVFLNCIESLSIFFARPANPQRSRRLNECKIATHREVQGQRDFSRVALARQR